MRGTRNGEAIGQLVNRRGGQVCRLIRTRLPHPILCCCGACRTCSRRGTDLEAGKLLYESSTLAMRPPSSSIAASPFDEPAAAGPNRPDEMSTRSLAPSEWPTPTMGGSSAAAAAVPASRMRSGRRSAGRSARTASHRAATSAAAA
eukprot:scaffold122101_cov34-Tisochrysis_lutea.AAC.5